MITPEPAGDIRAQLRAVIDERHPKRACFVVPEDRVWVALRMALRSADRPEGTLVARNEDADLFAAFRAAPSQPEAAFDEAMAEILGYPEAKPIVMLACGGRPVARAVQARSADDWVIHEALTSPAMLERTRRELQKHVPPGGRLVVLTPDQVLARRLSLREAGK